MANWFTIRPARAADAASVEVLLTESRLPLDGLRDQFGDHYAIAVDEGGAVLGVEGMEVYGEYGLLRSAAVRESARGRGVGDALTRDRIGWARQQGLRDVYLLTTTASAFFPRFGFVPASRDDAPDAIRHSREFAEACPASASFMRLSLGKER